MQRRRVRGGGWWRNGRQDPRGTGTRAWLLHEAKGGWWSSMHGLLLALDGSGGSLGSLSLSLHYPCGHAPPPMLAVGRARTPCAACVSAAGMGKRRCNRAGMGHWMGRARPANANHLLGWAPRAVCSLSNGARSHCSVGVGVVGGASERIMAGGRRRAGGPVPGRGGARASRPVCVSRTSIVACARAWPCTARRAIDEIRHCRVGERPIDLPAGRCAC